MLLYGMLASGLNAMGFARVLSNREGGDGRFDLMLVGSDRDIYIELKSVGQGDDLGEAAEKALGQIFEGRYYLASDKGKDAYAVGIAFRGKECRVLSGKVEG